MKVGRTTLLAGIFVITVLAFLITVMAAAYIDVQGYLATDSKTYTANGPVSGKAIIVYSPGLSGQVEGAVNSVAAGLAEHGYEVIVAGVSSRQAQDLSGYDLVIIGSPNYGARPTARVKEYIQNMPPCEEVAIGVLCTSAMVTTKGVDAMAKLVQDRNITVKATMTVSMTESAGPAASAFVNELLKT